MLRIVQVHARPLRSSIDNTGKERKYEHGRVS